MSGASLMVIGGTGFFGKSFLDAHRRGLLAPWRIERLIVVARDPGRLTREHPDLVTPAVELVAADIRDAAALPVADYVIHAANTTDARRYQADPLGERASILAAAANFAALARTHLAGSRIVYASSGAVYGQQPPELSHIGEDFTPEGAGTLTPYKRDYAEAKLLAERTVGDLGQSGLAVAVARCFAFVGVHLPRDQHFAIGNFLRDALAGRAIEVRARTPIYRSYMHADDLVRWLLTIADAARPACPIYNVGSDEVVSLHDLAHRIARRCGVEVRGSAALAEPVDRYVPSIAKARREIGPPLILTLDRAIADVIERLRCAARVNLVRGAHQLQ